MADPMKKPSLALVISSGKKAAAGDGDDTQEEADESSEDYSASVDELFDAVKSGDREAFATAFKAAVMSCK